MVRIGVNISFPSSECAPNSEGFTISLPEYGETIETLWETVRGAHPFVLTRMQTPDFCRATVGFMDQNPDLIAPNNGLGFISDDGGTTYNRCHCMFVLSSSGIPSPPDCTQSGAISRLQISTFGALRHT